MKVREECSSGPWLSAAHPRCWNWVWSASTMATLTGLKCCHSRHSVSCLLLIPFLQILTLCPFQEALRALGVFSGGPHCLPGRLIIYSYYKKATGAGLEIYWVKPLPEMPAFLIWGVNQQTDERFFLFRLSLTLAFKHILKSFMEMHTIFTNYTWISKNFWRKMAFSPIFHEPIERLKYVM